MSDPIEEIRQREQTATPGPWGWRGNTDHPTGIRLGSSSGWHDVLGLIRHEVTRDEARRGGVGDPDSLTVKVADEPAETYDQRWDAAVTAAQEEAITEYLTGPYGEPLTENRLAFVTGGMYRAAQTFAVYEVCRDATDRNDPRVYRADIADLNHPDARFIAHAREDVRVLLAEADRLDRVRKLHHVETLMVVRPGCGEDGDCDHEDDCPQNYEVQVCAACREQLELVDAYWEEKADAWTAILWPCRTADALTDPAPEPAVRTVELPAEDVPA